MYERSYGPKYNIPHKYASAAEIAKHIRADIKAAIKVGSLPGAPRNYRVQSKTFSGGQSINIRAVGLDGMWQQCDGTIPGTQDVYTDENGDIRFGPADTCRDYWCKAGGAHKDLPGADYHQTITVEGRRVLVLLEGMHAAYNHDGSDIQTDYFDVRYYGTADIAPVSNEEASV